jgi:hypothetical protein
VSLFLVILLCVAVFVVGQVSMLRPSRRDTFLMDLRAGARALGLHPRLLPPPEWYRGDRPAGGLLACYLLLVEADGKGLPYARAERLGDGEWVVRAGDRALLAGLSLPPEAAALTAIEVQGNAVSLWWQEGLGVEALPALLQLARDVMKKYM